MGVVNLALHGTDDGALATAVGPMLRHLFPPPAAGGNRTLSAT